jgi:hypothetical protein
MTTPRRGRSTTARPQPAPAGAPTADRPPHPSWLDLLPEGAPKPGLIPRRELLAELARRGHRVPYTALRHWEKRRLLPRPIAGGAEGGPRALYPWFAVGAVAEVRRLQTTGRTLEELRPRIWDLARTWAINSVGWADPLRAPLDAAGPAVAELARAAGPWVRGPIAAAYVRFVDGEGREVGQYQVPLPGAPGCGSACARIRGEPIAPPGRAPPDAA